MKKIAIALIILSFGCSQPSSSLSDISPEEFLTNPPDEAIVLDVRSAQEYASGHVPDAINIPHDQVGARLTELGTDKSRPVVVYCERGGRASKAASVLLDAGYQHVLHLSGDMSEWREKQRPIVVPEATGVGVTP